MSEEELIKTLRAFEKDRVEQLEEPARNLFYAIMKIADERDRLNNIINELENYIRARADDNDTCSVCSVMADDLLNILKGSE